MLCVLDPLGCCVTFMALRGDLAPLVWEQHPHCYTALCKGPASAALLGKDPIIWNPGGGPFPWPCPPSPHAFWAYGGRKSPDNLCINFGYLFPFSWNIVWIHSLYSPALFSLFLPACSVSAGMIPSLFMASVEMLIRSMVYIYPNLLTKWFGILFQTHILIVFNTGRLTVFYIFNFWFFFT